MPHSPAQGVGSGGETAGEYDRGPSTGAGEHLHGGETNLGGTRSSPGNTGETVFTVSREWLATGKGGELASILGELASTYAREDTYLQVQEMVVDRECDKLETDLTVLIDTACRARQGAHGQQISVTRDRAWVVNRVEKRALEYTKFTVTLDRRELARRGWRFNSLRAALVRLGKGN